MKHLASGDNEVLITVPNKTRFEGFPLKNIQVIMQCTRARTWPTPKIICRILSADGLQRRDHTLTKICHQEIHDIFLVLCVSSASCIFSRTVSHYHITLSCTAQNILLQLGKLSVIKESKTYYCICICYCYQVFVIAKR